MAKPSSIGSTRLGIRPCILEEVQSSPSPHPSGTNTAPELVTYSFEEAERAVNLLFDVLETCVQNPKPDQRQLDDYVTRFKGNWRASRRNAHRQASSSVASHSREHT